MVISQKLIISTSYAYRLYIRLERRCSRTLTQPLFWDLHFLEVWLLVLFYPIPCRPRQEGFLMLEAVSYEKFEPLTKLMP